MNKRTLFSGSAITAALALAVIPMTSAQAIESSDKAREVTFTSKVQAYASANPADGEG
ncbi:hypothetical protein ACR8AL_05060 [Clavibacter sepedonicus]|nr:MULTISPECIES: hypothetical protein [Clavibacter]MBD5382244.1 hypothetical protein [Clavibacter sp.]UUK65564.1 hypothetical protein LRE50_15050 [Clavibacter sepedonicus]